MADPREVLAQALHDRGCTYPAACKAEPSPDNWEAADDLLGALAGAGLVVEGRVA